VLLGPRRRSTIDPFVLKKKGLGLFLFISDHSLTSILIFSQSSYYNVLMYQNQANIVPQPMVGGSTATMNREGPWPDCIGMTGSECAQMIKSMAPDLDANNVMVVSFDSMMTMDFRTDRVRIIVGSDGVCLKAPSRG
jgi:hypothetical protein